MNGRSQPYFFAFEPGPGDDSISGHCVRFETITLPIKQFQDTKFTLLGADIDKDQRIRKMVECVRESSY